MSKRNKFTHDADDEDYRWIGSEVKCFVEENLKLQGIWSSPGGNVKLFCTAENLNGTVYIWSLKLAMITTIGSESRYLKA